MTRIHLIIAAGGKGLRLGGSQKKQFLPLRHLSILEWSLKAFESVALQRAVVVIPAEHKNLKLNTSFDVRLVEGGASRSESVYNGFKALGDLNDDDLVLIHDAARCVLPASVIESVLQGLQKAEAVVPGIPVTDTIKGVDDQEQIQQTVNRDFLRAVQTPQGFKASVLKRAYANLDFKNPQYTDESMLVEALGVPVKVVLGDARNIKVTQASDLQLAEFYLFQSAQQEVS